MSHDPLNAVIDGEVTPPSAWESLAQQARWLAEVADRYARTDPKELAPSGSDDDPHDPLAEMDARALAIRGAVAACRRSTWQALADSGLTAAEIGRLWGVSRQAVSQALVRPNRPR